MKLPKHLAMELRKIGVIKRGTGKPLRRKINLKLAKAPSESKPVAKPGDF